MSFLPENYETPQNESNYMKFEQGDNRFRALGSPIIGWEAWKKDENGDRKPVRFRMDEKPTDLREFENQRVNHFWAFPVWNYHANKIQILQITQKSIMKSIEQYTKDEDWGDPREFDIVVSREGEDLNTKYSVMAKPKKELDPAIREEAETTNINLNALYEGGDPFAENDEEVKAEDLPM